MVLLNSTVTETIIERQRWYVLGGWSGTLLFSDPPQWSDTKDKPETKDDIVLPDENGEEWRWTSDWEVFIHRETETASSPIVPKEKFSSTITPVQRRHIALSADLDAPQQEEQANSLTLEKSSVELALDSFTDANGWVYATSFTTAKNWSADSSSGLKIVRLRRWTRTRGKRDLRGELASAHSPVRREEFSEEELALAEKLVSKYDSDGDGLLRKQDLLRLLKEEKGLDEVFNLDRPGVVTRQTSADDPTICTVCYVGKVNCCIVPCGHHVLCKPCADSCLKKEKLCPVCRKPVQQLIQTFTT